ncbi:MAG TPA: nucleotidyltransferase family protein [Chitinophagaceae bacterium]|nr:nucleotidyltransferase family protein [Chitinophagaceae bacterium]
MSSTNETGAIILAGGSSSRLGKPKQLLEFDGKSLLQKSIDAAINSDADPVIVVLGANAEQILPEIDKSNVHVIINSGWEEGMASSIRVGLNEVLFNSPSAEAVILMVCDQPFISPGLINELVNTQNQTGKPIVSCNYGEAVGPPALFHRSLFNELMDLKGDLGARSIIRQHGDEAATILFPKGQIDIDTQEDYNALGNS